MKDLHYFAESFRKLLNIETEPEFWDVEKGHVKRFAQAIGDTNPLWYDEEYARNTRYGGVIAPPFFLIDVGLVKLVDKLVEMCPSLANINAGTEVEYYKPMRVGDRIKTVARLVDVQEKTGKSGPLILLTLEVRYINQEDELVAKCRNIFIRR